MFSSTVITVNAIYSHPAFYALGIIVANVASLLNGSECLTSLDTFFLDDFICSFLKHAAQNCRGSLCQTPDGLTE